MPELPEVESIKLQLQKFLVGHSIQKVQAIHPVFQLPEDKIVGSKVTGIRRFGKVTVIDLSNNYSILIHVKLTGQIIYRGPNLKNTDLSQKVVGGLGGPHTLVVFELDRGGKLYYNDIRKFGWIRVERTEDVENEKFIKKLGKDALEITSDEFTEIIAKTKRNIKVLLMDQEKISGVGNIYANDALWKAGIDPKRPAKSLTNLEINKLYISLRDVLSNGLKYGGASELSFVRPDGTEGEYQNHTLIFGHTGQLCPRCKKTKIEKYFLGGRGTYVCPNCQK